jgi:hypothetical protein
MLQRAFDPSEPRDEAGKWTDGGGGDGDSSGGGAGEHPGPGYSSSAYVKDGVIHTKSVYDAQRALHENRKVELDQPRKVSVLLQKLGEESKKLIAKGESAPIYNLCNVSVKGTNLFCADTKGIPRVQMPQLHGEDQTKKFVKHLEKKGYEVEKDKVHASHLRPTQNELNGAMVGRIAHDLEKSGGEIKRLIVSKDDYILDGHHHWAAKIGVDAANNRLTDDMKVKVSRVNISITKLLKEAEEFTGGKGKKPVGDEKVFDPSEPRDEQGQWTDGGGGGGGESAEEVGQVAVGEKPSSVVRDTIGKDLDHRNMETLKAAVDRGVWDFKVKSVRDSYGQKITSFEMTPKIPSNWEAHKNAITGTPRYYDPAKAHVNADGYVSPKDRDTSKALPQKGEPGIIYRGMSYEEYQKSLASGQFASVGDYNIGEQELGLTYFSSDPSQAESYAHGFAPWPYMAVPGSPAVVIAVADPGGAIVAPSRPTELGINKPIPVSALRDVYFGNPIIVSSGHVDVIQSKHGDPPQEGSRFSPSITVEWQKGALPAGASDRQMGPTTADKFVAARDESKRTAFLSDKPAEELKNDKLFLSGDRHSGYALDPSNDLQNLFNNGPKGGGKVALNDAIRNGAATLDAFDGHLPMLYAKHGFVPTGRMKFSDEYAPKGWDYAKYGRPDVVFMAYRGGDRQTIESRAGTFPPYDPSQGEYFTDYDAAKAASRSAVVDKGIEPGLPRINGACPEHRGRGQFHQELEDPSRRPDEAGERFQLGSLIERGLRLEDHPRRIYVRSHLLQAHHAISAMEADGLEIIPYDGPHIPGTELIDVGEWDERAQPNLKTLYVSRPLLNASEVVDWAKGQGFAKTITADDMHVTVAFSRITVDWDTFTEDHSVLTISPGGQRSVERLGPNAEAVVLRFESEALQERWAQFINAGASWDFDDYRPHITITFDAPDINVEDVEPYDGELIFGPEVFAELKDDWKATVTEKDFDEGKHPRDDHGRWTEGGGGEGAETGLSSGSERITVDQVKQAGITVDASAAKWIEDNWHELNVTPATFHELVTSGRGASVELKASPSQKILDVDVQFDHGGGYIQFNINIKEGKAYIDLMRMTPTGAGLAKKAMGNLVDLLQRSSTVTKVNLYANIKVGAYAWAKYGFVPSQMEWNGLKRSLKDRLDYLPDDVGQRVGPMLKSDDPRVLWAVSDDPRGDDIMIENGWNGTLNFDDEQAMRRFNAYIGKSPVDDLPLHVPMGSKQ